MTSSPSSPPSNEQGCPVHEQNIQTHILQPHRSHLAFVAKGIQTAFLGPMPPRQFISEFFPLDVSEEVSSAFEVGFFDEVIGLRDLGGEKKKMCDHFVRIILPCLVARS
jgi:hypothetical protein